MEFANKEYLLLLLLIIPYLIWYVMYRKKTEPTLRMSDTFAFRYAPRSWKVALMPLSMLLRLLVFVMIVLVMARPQTQNSWDSKTVEGIDIMLSMDVSTSMLAEDLRPNRIEAAKQVASEFIIGRPNDNIGLVIFAGESFTQCPMTTDHASLLNLLQNVRTDIAARGLIEDGTAIGMGLANAVSRLKDSKAKSKVVILLTDGSNNRGDISPSTAVPTRLHLIQCLWLVECSMLTFLLRLTPRHSARLPALPRAISIALLTPRNFVTSIRKSTSLKRAN